MGKLGFGVILIIAFLGIGAIVWYFAIDNKFVTTKNLYEAQIAKDKIIHDKMWKIISQQAGVTENYAESFEKIYTKVMKERYENGGTLMKWITEANPNYTPELHVKLMSTIEVYRNEFADVQIKLVSIHNEMKNQLTLFPSRFFLVSIGGHTLPELNIVTSTKTDDAFFTGKDDDTQLFKSDSTKR